jgi:hypothetical protein
MRLVRGARLRRILGHRAVAVTLALLVAWGAFSLWADWAGARKLTAAELASARNGRLNVAVTLDFAPEAFHMMILQSIGRLIEVKGETAYLMDVPVDEARSLARRYWVRDVAPWQGR